MQGKIIKGIAGFYYVHVYEYGIYECKAKGIFRNQNIKPLVGDSVLIDVIDEENKKGNITNILKRKNLLFRPAVANVDQALVVFAAADPAPNFNLLDKFLIIMKKANVPVNICFNKADVVSEKELDLLLKIYEKCGYNTFSTSVLTNYGVDYIKSILKGKTTVLAGPSGVGKSSLLNLMQDNTIMEIGELSLKIKRGKHTTRHSELIYVDEGTYVMDTPGFSSIVLEDIEYEFLNNYFIEFDSYRDKCRFNGCVHINEPNCAVKKALEDGQVSQSRYESYKYIYEDIKSQRRW
ncbi:MAG: rsgA [Clostridiales bacterium]|jgi:ribosome biogenesis GTPase|nr:rsgA [Clostridiales bacterium]